MSGREERERAVELYFSTSMSTKQVVEHLGYPTRQCPGTVAARRSQVCGCRPQAAHTVGDAVSRGGIVPVRYAAEAGGDGAWRRRRCGASLDETVPRRWNGGAGDRNGGMPCRRPEPIASRWAMTRMCCVGGYGSWSRGNALMREAVRGRRKRPGRRPAAPVEPGEDDAGRPAEAEVFAEVADMLAAVSRPAATTSTTRGSASASTPGCAPAWRGRSPTPRAGTGTVASRPRSGRASRRTRSAGSWPRAGSRRMFPNGGATAPTRARSRPRRTIWSAGTSAAPAPNVKWLTDTTRDQGRRREGVPLADDRLP